jgi:hypothetical protein
MSVLELPDMMISLGLQKQVMRKREEDDEANEEAGYSSGED